MSIELKIPEIGESITEVQISEWLKSEGDEVKKDEPVAVIDSEKTTFELPAPQEGRLTKIAHKAGDTVKVGETVAEIDDETPGKKPAETQAKSEPTTRAESDKKTIKADKTNEKEPKPEPIESAIKRKNGAQKDVSPADLPAEQKPVPVETKAPEAKPSMTGKVVAADPSPGREQEVVPMTMLRRTAARRLVDAQQAMAMLTTFNEIDLSAVQALRKQHGESFEKRYQVKLGLMSFFVKAAIDALKQYPTLNAEVRGNDIVYRNYFDIGIAVATERGLVVPVVRNAEQLSFAELEKNLGDFAHRAREGKLQPDELDGGTFTITNGGVFGSLLSTPIINPPQSGILGMHAIQERPVAVQGQVVVRPMMYLALTYDHRITDGRQAVLFLHRMKEVIEAPARMLIEI